MSAQETKTREKGLPVELVARLRGSAWGFVFLVFVTNHLLYLIAGALLASIVPISSLQRQTTLFPLGTLSIWANFDGEHYVNVAESDYGQDSPAFFPLYPLLMRLTPYSVVPSPEKHFAFAEPLSL